MSDEWGGSGRLVDGGSFRRPCPMLDGWVTPNARAYPPSASDVVEMVRELSSRELAPIVQKIDADAHYPETVMRAFGRAGAFACHLPGETPGGPDLVTANRAMAAAGEYCLSTSFCMWCQNALGWYIFASENEGLKTSLGRRVAVGEALGGTALSNPMKAFFGIEKVRLKGTRVDGGYLVRGALPYVSNLGNDHYFGAVFEIADAPLRYAMTIVSCAAKGMKLSDNTKFVALDGTRTFSVQLRDVIIPDSFILADPSDAFIKRIRAGFVLLQAGMGIGLIRSCIALMNQVKGPLGHVNKYLEVQPERLAEELGAIEASVERLAVTPFETDQAYWRSVLEARLAVGEAAVGAAHAAMLHCGARGFVANATAQRRLRESYFAAIVTPAIKQLKKMLADMAN
jgi:alkylation response protein AidB-like acyl-CoA dehydrogenase